MIKIEKILKQIEEKLNQSNQWGKGEIINYGFAEKYSTQAEALIELLEIHNCGVVGGFDKRQKIRSNLEERYKWLKNKENQG